MAEDNVLETLKKSGFAAEYSSSEHVIRVHVNGYASLQDKERDTLIGKLSSLIHGSGYQESWGVDGKLSANTPVDEIVIDEEQGDLALEM